MDPRRIAAAAAAMLFAAFLSFAQEVTADIRGTIHDPTGAGGDCCSPTAE